MVLLLLTAWAVAPGPSTWAQPSGQVIEVDDLRELEAAFVRLAERVRPSAVSIRTFTLARFFATDQQGVEEARVRMPRSHGSGAVIRPDGYILTSTHVIQGADEVVVILHDGRELEAELVRADQRSDLAVLKIDTVGLRPVVFGNLSSVRQGQWCFAVGNPFGLSNDQGRTSMSYGIVEGLGKDLSVELNADVPESEKRYYGNLIQTSAAINPGNSGGPLFNIGGQMIGVVTAIESRSGVSEGVGFAIPIDDWTRQVVESLEEGRDVRYGFLGILVEPPARAALAAAGIRTPRGAQISRLTSPDGPAAQAQLRVGDIIIEFNGTSIDSTGHLVRLVGATPVGETVEVVYLRGGQRSTTRMTVAAREVSQVTLGSSDDPGPRTCRWRGAWLQEPTDALLQQFGTSRAEAGLAIVEVESGSDAAAASLEPGQLILTVNRQRVRTIEDFLAAERKAGAQVLLGVHTERGIKTVPMPQGNR